MPPVDVSSQNLRERSLQVSAPRSRGRSSRGKKRIRSLDVLAHRGRHLEHRAAVPEAVDLADGAALVDALLLDVGPERLERLAAGGLAVDAGDLRQGGGEVTGLKMPLPDFFCLAAFLLPAAIDALLLCWPLRRLPPTKRPM